MTDTNRLEQAIESSGLKKKFICGKLGLSGYGFSLKVRGKNDFTASEIALLTKLLGLTRADRDAIFFAKDVDDTST